MSRPADLLDRALAADATRPLLTFYDDASGERTELSVATFANWAAKTANLLRDALDAQPGGSLALRLPTHWQAYVWVQAAWLAGLSLDLRTDARVDVAVVTHDDPGPADADEVVSLALGPMGLPQPGRLPAYAGALDYDREVHSHGDRFIPGPDTGGAAVRSDAGDVTFEGLLDTARSCPALPPGGRLLVTRGPEDVEAVLGGLVVPLATAATAVLCRHLDPERLPDRIRQESLVSALGNPMGSPDVLDLGLPEFRAC